MAKKKPVDIFGFKPPNIHNTETVIPCLLKCDFSKFHNSPLTLSFSLGLLIGVFPLEQSNKLVTLKSEREKELGGGVFRKKNIHEIKKHFLSYIENIVANLDLQQSDMVLWSALNNYLYMRACRFFYRPRCCSMWSHSVLFYCISVQNVRKHPHAPHCP